MRSPKKKSGARERGQRPNFQGQPGLNVEKMKYQQRKQKRQGQEEEGVS